MTLPPSICKHALFRSKWGRLMPAIGVGFIRLAVGILGHSPLQLDTGQCKTKIRLRLPSLSSLKWSFLCCVEVTSPSEMSGSFTFHRGQGSLKCFRFSSPPRPPHPINFTFIPTQMTFIRALTPFLYSPPRRTHVSICRHWLPVPVWNAACLVV